MRFLFTNIYGVFRTLRPRQWPKNGFVYVALVFDQKLTYWPLLLRTTLAFFLFCMISGAVYIVNDLVDLEKDRQHPQKRRRPLPSGKLQPWFAVLSAVVILAICLPLSFWLNSYFGFIVSTYFVLNLAYSYVLKNVVIIDVIVVAAGFVLRVAAGVAVAQAEHFSPWLYVFIIFFALFLSIGKRRHELKLLAEGATSHRRILDAYNLTYLDGMIQLVAAGTVISYSLYTFSAVNLPPNDTMMLTIPFCIYFVFRIMYLMQVKGLGGAPERFLYIDKPLLLDLALWGISILLILYVVNP